MKVVLITGAAQGIGLATVCHLIKQDYFVYALIRRASDASRLDVAISQYPDNLSKIYADVTNTSSIEEAIQRIIKEKGHIDVAINNACYVVVGTCETCTIEEQQRSMDVNYFGPVRIVQAVLPQMREQCGGKIIQISSIAGYEPFPHLEAYVASKFALEGLSESLAAHLAPWNITISLVEPGGVKTKAPGMAPLGSRALQDTDGYHEYLLDAKNQMIKSYDHSMEPTEVVKVIETILNSERPHLHYPVGEFAKECLQRRFRDPEGDSYVESKIDLLKNSYKYHLLGK